MPTVADKISELAYDLQQDVELLEQKVEKLEEQLTEERNKYA